MRPNKFKVGQRWILGPYVGYDKFLLAEISNLDITGACFMKVLYYYPGVADIKKFWEIDCELHETRINISNKYWSYLEGQDAPHNS